MTDMDEWPEIPDSDYGPEAAKHRKRLQQIKDKINLVYGDINQIRQQAATVLFGTLYKVKQIGHLLVDVKELVGHAGGDAIRIWNFTPSPAII